MTRTIAIVGGLLGLCGSTLCLADTLVTPIVELSTKERYDDDPIVFGRAEYFSEISPEGGLQVANETLQMKAWYSPDLMYAAVAETPEVDHRAHFDLRDRLTDHLTLRSDLGFWRVSDPTSLPRLGVATIDAPVLYTLDSVGVSDAFTRRWTWDLDYQVEAAQVLGAEAIPPLVPPVGNSPLGIAQTPSTGVRYELTERTEVGLKDRYQLFTSAADTVGQADSVYATLAHHLTETWTLKGEAGPTAFDDPQAHVSLIPHLQGEVEHEGKYTEIGLVAGRDLIGAVGYAAVVWAEYAQLAVAAHPIHDLRVYAVGGLFENGPAPASAVDLNGYSIAGGLTYNFTREFAGNISAIHIFSQPVGPVVPGAVPVPFVDENTNIASVQLAWTPVIDSKHL